MLLIFLRHSSSLVILLYIRMRHDNQTGFAYHKALKVLNENVVVPFAVTK